MIKRAVMILCESHIDGLMNAGNVSGMVPSYVYKASQLQSFKLRDDIEIRRTIKYYNNPEYQQIEQMILACDERIGHLSFASVDGIIYPVTQQRVLVTNDNTEGKWLIQVILKLAYGSQVLIHADYITLAAEKDMIWTHGSKVIEAS